MLVTACRVCLPLIHVSKKDGLVHLYIYWFKGHSKHGLDYVGVCVCVFILITVFVLVVGRNAHDSLYTDKTPNCNKYLSDIPATALMLL